MRKVIAAINMTLDGFCDHTAGIADAELHQHYAELLDTAGVILYGRTTYQLMQYWQGLLQNPSGDKTLDEFAVAIDKVQKIVFSSTLSTTEWNSAVLATSSLEDSVNELKQETGKDILIGSRSLIIQLLNSQLIDSLQICIHPVVAGKGLALFNGIESGISLKLIDAKFLKSGATVLHYEPLKISKEAKQTGVDG